MLDSLTTYLNEGTVYYALEVCGNASGEQFHVLEIQRKKQELFMLGGQTFDALEKAAETLKKDRPIFLVMNTAKVLTKIIPPSADENYESLVHSAFPNLDFKDFYYEVAKTKTNTLIAISRKEEVDGYLDTLSKQGLHPMGISLGVSCITNIRTYIAAESIAISNSRLGLNESSIEHITALTAQDITGQEAYDINGLEVDRKYVLGFSGILGHLSKSWQGIGNLNDVTVFHKSEFINKRHFKLLLQSSLVFILGLLFVNFLLFNHYFENVGALEEALAVNNANKEQLLRLNAEVKRKEDRVNAVLDMTNSNTSAILDDLGKDIPASILLNEINYQPLLKPLRDAKPIELEYGVLNVSGEASDNTDFYNWIASLEKLKWVQSVETTDYDYGSGNTSNFSIKITLDE